MNADRVAIDLLEIALGEGAFRKTSRLASLPTADETFTLAAPEIESFSFILLDVLLDVRDRLVVIEANGSNAALSSVVSGDGPRARHFAAALLARRLDHPEARVVLLPHAPGFLHVAEFTARALRVVDSLERGGLRCAAASPGARVDPDADLTVILGSIDALTPHVTVQDGLLCYDGALVALASNANLLPALARAGQLEPFDESVFHEGPLTRLVHDRVTQQELCRGTGFTPLRTARADDLDSAIQAVADLRADGAGAFVKIHGGSGGNGVVALSSTSDDDAVRTSIVGALSEAASVYGDGVMTTAFPLQIFEFAQAIPYPMHDGGHLWDMRIQILISPGQIRVTPCVVRLCPAPYTGRMDRDAVVANLTGRPASSETLRATRELLTGIGFPDEHLRMANAAGAWAKAAMRAYEAA